MRLAFRLDAFSVLLHPLYILSCTLGNIGEIQEHCIFINLNA